MTMQRALIPRNLKIFEQTVNGATLKEVGATHNLTVSSIALTLISVTQLLIRVNQLTGSLPHDTTPRNQHLLRNLRDRKTYWLQQCELYRARHCK